MFVRAGVRAKPRVYAQGSRSAAFKAFCAALVRCGPDDQLWLLVDIENISKVDIDTALRDATKDTKAGRYDKGKHSFDLLRQLDPEKLERASPWAFRLFRALHTIEID